MHDLFVHDEYMDKYYVFKDRFDAGEKLGEWLLSEKVIADIVFAIPAGGVPVGYVVAKKLKAKLDVLVCRKLLIPWNREAGFGAMDPDGEYFVDEELVSHIGLTGDMVKAAIEEQKLEIKRRLELFRNNLEYGRLNGLRVIVVDDGIAAGYTMTASIRFLRRRGVKEVIVAVPTCNLESARRVACIADKVYCMNPRTTLPYAVADAYLEWHDLSEDEVLEILYKAWKEGLLNYSLKP